MLVYDNHWARRRKAASFDNDSFTYVTIYDINEKEKTVRLYKKFASPKTRIRANGIYVAEKRRVYNMAGSYAEPVDGNRGGVYEYDFDTGEVVSEFGVKPGYFRGYEFTPHIEKLAEPMEVLGNYMSGELKRPKEMEEAKYQEAISHPITKVKNPKISYVMQEDLLFIWCTDHEVEKVYFFGRKGKYSVDFDDTYQTMEIFKKMEYLIAMQLDKLPPDRYNVFIKTEGRIEDCKKYIKIKE
jgi:hypothetical protein